MKFNTLKLLLEAFSNWEYHIPENKKELLFDFYMLSNLPEPQNEDLKISLNNARNKLMVFLKDHLLNHLFFAICSEFRHSILETSKVSEITYKNVFQNKNKKYDEVLQKYMVSWEVRPSAYWDNRDNVFKHLNKVLNELNISEIEFVKNIVI